MKNNSIMRIIAIILSIVLFVQVFPSYALPDQIGGTNESAELITETTNEIKAIAEVTEKRDAVTKHYRMSDGTYQMYSYMEPIHMEEDGKWVEIDQTLTLRNGRMEPKKSPLPVSFATQQTDALFELEDPETGAVIRFDLLNKKAGAAKVARAESGILTAAAATLDLKAAAETEKISAAKESIAEEKEFAKQLRNKITYTDILTNADLEYDLSANQIKESIIIRKSSGTESYSFAISAAEYRLIKAADNSIGIYRRADDRMVYQIQAPYMFDAAGAQSIDIAVDLQEQRERWIITVTPSAQWLQDPARKFPVTLDPTVLIPYSTNHIKMASYHSGADEVTHFSVGDVIYDAIHFTDNSADREEFPEYADEFPDTYSEVYIKFDLPPLELDHIYGSGNVMNQPLYGCRIVNAELNLYANKQDERKPPPIYVYQNMSWTNNFNEANLPNRHSSIDALIEYDSYYAERIGYHYLTADITQMVQKWYSIPTSNYGLCITPATDGNECSYDVNFNSSAEAPLPNIAVSYVCNIGLEEYWTYTAESLNNASVYINHHSGALTAVFADTVSNNQRNGFGISHIYNDDYAKSGYMASYEGANVGRGFRLNIQETIAERYFDHSDETYYLHIDSDGTPHYFIPTDQTSGYPKEYKKETDPSTVLTILNSVDSKLVYKDKSYKEFTNGHLTALVDTAGNRVEIEVEFQEASGVYLPIKVKEILSANAKRETGLTWDIIGSGSTASYQLKNVISPEGSNASFTYDSSGKLTRIDWGIPREYNNYSTEKQSLSFYYANHLLCNITEPYSGDRILLGRESNTTTAKVIHLEKINYIGDDRWSCDLEFSYTNHTKIIDRLNDDYTMVYRFDRAGKTIGISDQLGGSKYYEYGTQGGAQNKITLESKLIRQNNNLLIDSSFEETNDIITNVWESTDSDAFYGGDAYVDVNECISQLVRVDRTGPYCFSAEVLIDDPVWEEVILSIYDEDGNLVASESERLGDKIILITELAAAETYHCRIENQSASIAARIYNVYLNYYESLETGNEIINGGFSFNIPSVSGQFLYGKDYGWSELCDGDDVADFSNGYLAITGNPTEKNIVLQPINVSGNAGDEIVFSAAVANNGLPTTDTGSGTKTAAAITIAVYYTDGTVEYETVMIPPNTDLTWFHISDSLIAAKNFETVTIYLKNDRSANVAYFDDIYLGIESYGTRYELDSEGNVVGVTGRNGESSDAQYNDLGQPTTTTDALGNATQYTYGKGNSAMTGGNDSQLLSETTPMGYGTQYQYDAYGNLVATATAEMGSCGDFSWGYSHVNHGKTVYGNYGTTIQYQLDPLGARTNYITDSESLRTEEINPPNTSYTEYDYYSTSNTVNGQGYIDQTGPVRSVTVRNESGSPNILSQVNYEYRNAGYGNNEVAAINRASFSYQIPKETTAEGTVTTGAVTESYERETSVSISGHGTLSRTYYDKRGLPLQTVYGNYNASNPAASTALYNSHYDQLGRIALTRRGNETTRIDTEYSYNREGSLFRSREYDSYRNLTTTEHFFYDLAGRVVQRNYKRGNLSASFNYGYDALSRLTFTDIFSAIFSYSVNSSFVYNANSQLVRHNFMGHQLNNQYDWYGRLSETTLAASSVSQAPISRSYSYATNNQTNTARQTTQISLLEESYFNPDINAYGELFLSYQYDNMGNISQITGDINAAYTYDGLGQLKSATVTDLYGEQLYSESFSYAYLAGEGYQGNISFANKNGTVYNYNYQTGWNDLLASITDAEGNTLKSFTYDNIGNMLSDGSRNYEWLFGRRLSSITGGSATEPLNIRYYYNSDGIRTGKSVNGSGTEYLIDGSTILAEKRGNRLLQYYYSDSGLALIAYNGKYYHPLTNLQGDILQLLEMKSNSSAVPVCNYTYSAFGELLSVEDPEGNAITDPEHIAHLNPFRYRGYYYDTETGFYLTGTRYYDPEIGRFINADGQINDDILGTNLFAYCGNNPVTRADDTGRGWWVVAGVLIGGIAGGVIKIVSNVTTGKKWNEGVIGATVGGAVYGGVLAATGNVWAAGFAGAAAESLTNEVVSYIPKVSQANGQTVTKKVTTGNVIDSTKTVLNDTAVNGTISAVTGKIAGKIVPTNNGWFKPQKFVSSFAGKYAIKSELQTLTQTGLLFGVEGLKYSFNQRFKQGQQPIVTFFPDTEIRAAG